MYKEEFHVICQQKILLTPTSHFGQGVLILTDHEIINRFQEPIHMIRMEESHAK